MITHQINLDMVPGGAPEVIHLSQYDNDATLIFSLYASSGLFTVAEGTTVAIRGTKSDGNGISLDAVISGTTVTVDLDQQITAVAGRNIFELTLYKNGKELNTANFIIDVERAAFDKDSIASDSKIREFVDVYDNIDLYLEYAQRAETAADQTTADKNSIREYRDAILADDSATKQAANAAMAAASDATNEVAELKNRLVNAENVNNAQTVTIEGKVDGAYVEDGYLYLTSNNEVVAGPLGPFSGTGGGGGASGGNAATLTVTNSTGWLSKTIASGRECPLSITWSSIEDEMPTGGGTLRITVNGAIKGNIAIEQGTIQPDIAPYLGRGSNVVKASVIDVYGNSRTINFSITVVDISISSSFDPSVVYSGPFTFPYTPIGNVAKTVFLEIDGRTIATKNTSVSNSQMSFAIPTQAHGSHKIRCWFTAEINAETVTSNVLYYEVITIALGNDAPIIAIQYGGTSVSQYQTVSIPYSVYDPAGLTAEIDLYENDRKVNTLTVDRTQQTWAYRSDTPGAVTLAIVCGDVRKELPLTITEADIEVQAETEDLSLYLSSYGRSNAEEHPDTWVYEDIECEFDDFNFTSDGWQSDDQGITVLRVGGDARLTIPFKPFATDARATGKTIEIEFATRRVRDYDATILSCMSGGKGIALTAQAATMTSELSSISTQYKEDEHVRLAFVVEKRSENRLVYIYINGIMSGTVQYPDTDNFEQASPVDITIGSNDCTVDLYCIRVYENDLTRRQILDNWIADCQDGAMLLDRYARNHVLDEYGQVTVANLPNDLPYMIITAPVLPQYKGDKKTVDITFVDPQYPTKSFTATGVELDVQGTSSAGYARKNYKAKFKNATLIVNGTQKSGYSINGGPVAKVFCYKADVASSEGANNVELVRFYEDLSPYKTPPQLEDSKIRQGIDGFPMVVFQNDGNETTFVGKYNHNYDKGAENVFGFADGDESWEVLNNNTNLALFKSADMTSPYTDSDGNEHQNWDRSFEGRYPDGNEDITALSRFVAWVNSTDQAAATGDALPEVVTYEGMTFTSDTAAYRLAKFKSEIDDYCERRALEFYYLFTEIFLMIDSRAKNAFWTAFMSAGGKWFSLPYDFDTAIGINNEGALAYGYSLEDGDSYKGSYVFNGQPSVLWVNLRQAFAGEIKSMYETLRAGNLSYAEIERRFEEHQSKWPEAIFNEDAYFKYLEPLITDGDAMYLEMLQGSKEQQRKWWLFNRFQYMDSKYQCGDASRATNRITLRAWAKSPITITPYSDIYCTVNWANGTIDSVRGERNHSYVMQCPIDTLNDTEVYIYSASQLASVGDLSGLMLRLANFSYATKLQDIKVGDADENYDNPHLTDLSFANNTLLQSLDVRNCSGLSTAIDISQCINIEEVYFDGTNIGGLVLPVGGVLRVLHLPESITNLTIRKQKKVTDLTVAGYDNITTLWIDDCNQEVWDHVPDILDAMAAGSRVRLIGLHLNLDTYAEIKALMDTLDTFIGMDEAGGNLPNAMQSISGSIHTESLTGAQIAELEARYPNVDVTADSVQSFVYFYNGETLIDTVEVLTVNEVSGDATYTGATPTKASTAHEDYGFIGWSLGQDDNTVDADALLSVGSDRNVYACYEVTHTKATISFYNGTTLMGSQQIIDGADAVYGGTTPTREATAANTFTFSGWSLGVDDNTVDSDALTAVTADRDVYACYTETLRKYTVTFVRASADGGGTLQTISDVSYGTSITAANAYTGSTPATTQGDATDYPFDGWNPASAVVQGDTVFTAKFKDLTSPTRGLITRTIRSVNSQATSIGEYAFYNCPSLTTVDLPEATSIGGYAFTDCSSLTTVDLPKATSIGGYVFNYCSKLTTVILRNTEQVVTLSNTNAFNRAINAIIYVPDSLVESYKAANKWSTYADRIKGLSELGE